MEWSPQQVRAIDQVASWLKDTSNQQVFRLFGYAGTGKTTLAKHLAADVGWPMYASFTGKAASVMRQRGCTGAMTIHQLIYKPVDRSKTTLHSLQEQLFEVESELPPEDRDTNELVLKLRKAVQDEIERLKKPMFAINPESMVRECDLVIIDECSMVGSRMAEDLMSFGTPILVLGDPAQLPPVMGGGYFTDHKPDFMLTEIHRQARDNPIIDLATRVREGAWLENGSYGESVILSGKPPEELVTSSDQILVGANNTRKRVNHRMRLLLGHGEEFWPVVNESLVCLRNDHQAGLLNGTKWTVNQIISTVRDEDRIMLGITSEDGETTMDVEAHMHFFQGRENELHHWEYKEAQCFDFGYALTTHKAQGSQWPRVFIFDESRMFGGSARRWLYTAITRASERVVICRR